MRRLCVYYRSAKRQLEARDFLGKVEWIVCKECQRKINSGQLPLPEGSAPVEALTGGRDK